MDRKGIPSDPCAVSGRCKEKARSLQARVLGRRLERYQTLNDEIYDQNELPVVLRLGLDDSETFIKRFRDYPLIDFHRFHDEPLPLSEAPYHLAVGFNDTKNVKREDRTVKRIIIFAQHSVHSFTNEDLQRAAAMDTAYNRAAAIAGMEDVLPNFFRERTSRNCTNMDELLRSQKLSKHSGHWKQLISLRDSEISHGTVIPRDKIPAYLLPKDIEGTSV